MNSLSATKTRERRTKVATLRERTDEELLLAYREQGLTGAFGELVRRYERELYSYLRRYLGNETTAEDAFQATFMQVHLKAHLFEAGRKFRPWLYTIATHQAIDAQRRGKRHRMVSLDRQSTSAGEDVGTLLDVLVSGEESPTASLDAQERQQWIRDAVAQLPDTLRAVVTLVYYQGLKYREAAEILDVPLGTVKSRVHAAILKLNEAWNADEPGRETPSIA